MQPRPRRDRLPVHLQDQTDAAEAEVRRNMHEAAQAMRVPLGTHTDHDGSDPVLDAMLDQIRTAVQARQVLMCRHAGTPQPLFLDWWRKPWTIRCTTCNALATPPSELEDNTCDNCGHVDPEGTWPSHLALGAVMVSFGRCDDCAPPSTRPKGHLDYTGFEQIQGNEDAWRE